MDNKLKDNLIHNSIMPTHSNTSADSTSSERLQGRVKWFNARAGYGFITVSDGDRQGTDVFCASYRSFSF